MYSFKVNGFELNENKKKLTITAYATALVGIYQYHLKVFPFLSDKGNTLHIIIISQGGNTIRAAKIQLFQRKFTAFFTTFLHEMLDKFTA